MTVALTIALTVIRANVAVIYATAGSAITCATASGATVVASAALDIIAVGVSVLGIRRAILTTRALNPAASSGSLARRSAFVALDWIGASMCRDGSGEYVCNLEGEKDGGEDIGDLHVG